MLIIPYNLCKRRNTTALAHPVALLPPPYQPLSPYILFHWTQNWIRSLIYKNIKSTGIIYIFCRFCQTNCWLNILYFDVINKFNLVFGCTIYSISQTYYCCSDLKKFNLIDCSVIHNKEVLDAFIFWNSQQYK